MLRFKNKTAVLLTLFVMILIVLGLIISRATYAYLAPRETIDLINQNTVTANGDILTFANGTPFSISASTSNFDSSSPSLASTTLSRATLIGGEDNITNLGEVTSNYDVKLSVTTNTFAYSNTNVNPDILLKVTVDGVELTTSSLNGLSYKTVTDASGTSQSGFDITTLSANQYTLFNDHSISTTSSTTGTTQEWIFKLIFVNYDFDQSVNEDAEMDLQITLDY